MSDIPQADEAKINEALFGKRPPARARFFLHGSKNEDATAAAGYPVYDDRVYIEVKIPDSKDFVSRLAQPKDYREFPEAAALFERVRNWTQHSLELLPGITTAQLATLRDLHLHTIEQLAGHTPETAIWTKRLDGDPYPKLEGRLPEPFVELQLLAKRFINFINKPRLRLVDGQLKEVS